MWESQLLGRSLAARAVVSADSVASATGTLLSAGTGTSRTQSVSAVDFSGNFGGNPGDWQIGLFVKVASTGAREKRNVKRPFFPPKTYL